MPSRSTNRSLQFDFFEEFPSREAFSRAKHIRVPTLVYIAAPELTTYYRHAASLKAANRKLRTAYWPLLPRSYWISPFSFPDELKRIHDELSSVTGLDVLLDLELPIRRPGLIFQNAHHFFSNRRLIREILKLSHRFLLAEYPAIGPISQKVLQGLGISYPEHESCVMYYSSMIQSARIRHWMQKSIRIRARNGQKTVGLGCLSKGILGTEPIITCEGLTEDIRFLRDAGCTRAVLFQLNGLDQKYAETLRNAN
ncbi:MAG: hypothetical protein JNM27_03200 [Leptospirales bacterium]|nr:hypothetical protein [Leptospirales bacterium]